MNPYDYYITPEEYAYAASNGISRQCLTVRIRQLGWDKHRAMTEPPKVYAPKSEWHDVAISNGISRGTFYDRVKRHGWEPERAATTPIAVGDDKLKAARKARRRFSDEIHELREANGITKQRFWNRINESGWDPYRAATEPVWTHQQICEAGKASSSMKKYVTF